MTRFRATVDNEPMINRGSSKLIWLTLAQDAVPGKDFEVRKVPQGRLKSSPTFVVSVCKAWRDCSLKMSKMLKVLKVLKVLIEHLASLAGWYSSRGRGKKCAP
jgi:hypothetical protein